MDSHHARIWFLSALLLVGMSSATWAEVPPCADSVADLWKFRQQVEVWTSDDGWTPVDGSLVSQLPDACYIEEGRSLSQAGPIVALDPWINSQGSLEVGDGIQALWLIDRILSEQVAAGMPMESKTHQELVAAIAERRKQFDDLAALDFPVSPTESIKLGEAMADLPAFRKTLTKQWHALDPAEQVQVRRRLTNVEQDLSQLHESGAIFLGPLMWDTVFTSSVLPMPVGEENIGLYLEFVEVAATYMALLEELEAKLAATAASPVTVATTVDARILEALRTETNPDKFREPLQIPPIAVTDNSQFLKWIRSLLSRFQVNGRLGLSLAGLLLCAGLLGWLAYLLVGGSDPWGKRSIRFRRGGEQEAVIRGRNLSPAAQFKLALQAARAGRHLEAWHWLTQGFILGLAQGQLVKLDWSRTNREVLRDLHHKRVAFIEPATLFFRTAEGVVYGGRGTSLAEIEQFERSLSRTLALLPKKSK